MSWKKSARKHVPAAIDRSRPEPAAVRALRLLSSAQACRRRVDASAQQRRASGAAPPVLFGFVRLATSRRVFAPPLHVDQALSIADGLARATQRASAAG